MGTPMKEHDPTGMPKGTSKGSGLISPAHSDVSGVKKPGSKMSAKGMRTGGSKR